MNAPLRQRMKARASNDKQIRPGHHGDATCRCVQRLHPEIKAAVASRLSFITHLGSGARALPFHWTKDPLYELAAVHGEQMLSKAYLFFVFFAHLSDSLSPLSVSKLLRFPPLSPALHFTLPL